MNGREVQERKEGLPFGNNFFLVGGSNISCLVEAVQDKLLGQAVGLNNDVLHPEWLFTDLEVGPSCTLIPTELDTINWLLVVSNDNERAVVTDLVDPTTWSDGSPCHATITRQIQILLVVVLAEPCAKISRAKHDTNC
jgi:hypothetical protein